MRNYLDLVQRVLDEGRVHDNRTGQSTRRIIGAQLEFDLEERFPLMTTRKLFTNGIVGELIGFIRGCTTAKEFRELGCNFWNANANDSQHWLENTNRLGEDDLGRIYGAQWRNWRTLHGQIDQLHVAINDVIHNPNSRRIIVSAWNPGELHLQALPPCHINFQLIADKEYGELSLRFTKRSTDLALGASSNIASYALLLELIAKATGYKAKKLIMQMTDVHIYESHIPALMKQLRRTPINQETRVHINSDLTGIDLLNTVNPSDISFTGYTPHDPLTMLMVP